MDNTPNLALPLLANKQALQTTFHDEALKTLDALVMLSVIDRDLSSPPPSPSEGDRYLVNAPGSGDPAWLDNRIVVFLDGNWMALAPRLGWTCYVEDEGALIAWDGAAWQPALDVLGGGAANNLALLGVGTTADAANPFSAKLNNALWVARTVAEGGDGDLRTKLSKESAANTLSVLFQDNFSGRAEIGLAGDDDFHFKVSPDGTDWRDAIVIDRATGRTRFVPDDAATGFALINGRLAASAVADALTVAIKTKAGGDPSASDPVSVVFRSATASSGDYAVLTLTAATAFTVASGATLGASNGTPFRIWIVGFDDGGTFRLGVVNCLSPMQVHPLSDAMLASSAGGSGGNSAGAIYTGTAVSAKPLRLLGFMEWTTGLAAAGTWSSGPTSIQPFGPGVAKPGDVVQAAIDQRSTAATGTNAIPADDTIPQNTEGDQYFSLTLTPTSPANWLVFRSTFCGAHTGGGAANGIALFQDAGADAIASVFYNHHVAGDVTSASFGHERQAKTGSSTTFKLRLGASGTFTLNGYGGTRKHGGVLSSFLSCTEIMA